MRKIVQRASEAVKSEFGVELGAMFEGCFLKRFGNLSGVFMGQAIGSQCAQNLRMIVVASLPSSSWRVRDHDHRSITVGRGPRNTSLDGN